jgi:uncharacterized protein (DUF1810 family)
MADSFNLQRFLDAQAHGLPYAVTAPYSAALEEIRAGSKYSHWIWYVFPQLKGLGSAPPACDYGISGIGEARAYLQEPTLRARLIEISAALLACTGDITQIAGYPDDLKICSSMTLFAVADPEIPVFRQVLDKFYAGVPDVRTLRMLRVKWE